MGTVGDALDNAVAESFFASLQCELLDRHNWPTRTGLARAMFAYIEAFYNPTRRHSTLGYLSPVDYEHAHAASSTPNKPCPTFGGSSTVGELNESGPQALH
jgi:putative transposase